MNNMIPAIGLCLSAAAACAADLPRPAITGVSHIAVYATDPAKSERFYVHDLGASKGGDAENARGVRYYFSPAQYVEVLPLPREHTINRLDHVAFATANAEGLRSYLAAHGSRYPAKSRAAETAASGSTSRTRRAIGSSSYRPRPTRRPLRSIPCPAT